MDRGYLRIARTLAKIDVPSIEPLRIKLLPGDDPIARAAFALRTADLGTRRRLHRNRQLGPLHLDQLYIYPPSEVKRSVKPKAP